jgi:AcrR family transcriptional regulator
VVARLTAAPAVRFDAPEVTRQAYLTYLTDGLTTTDRARAALAAAGAAPVPDGDAIAEQVRGDVADLRADLVDARSQVERADPGSAVALARALVGGSKLVSAVLNGAQVGGAINREPALHDAYDRAPSCAQLQRSGAPSTAPIPVPTR